MRFILIFLLCTGLFSCASTRKAEFGPVNDARSNSFAPYTPEEAMKRPEKRRRERGSFKDRYYQTLEEAREEFRDRMKANAKRYRKMQRKMEKPQYSNPLYFGHKRKPKKREPGKRKFCKECGIVH